MTEEDALLAAIAADPFAITPTLVYADWLNDRGRRGEEILRRVAWDTVELDCGPELMTLADRLRPPQGLRATGRLSISASAFERATREIDGVIGVALPNVVVAGPVLLPSAIFYGFSVDGWALEHAPRGGGQFPIPVSLELKSSGEPVFFPG